MATEFQLTCVQYKASRTSFVFQRFKSLLFAQATLLDGLVLYFDGVLVQSMRSSCNGCECAAEAISLYFC